MMISDDIYSAEASKLSDVEYEKAIDVVFETLEKSVVILVRV